MNRISEIVFGEIVPLQVLPVPLIHYLLNVRELISKHRHPEDRYTMVCCLHRAE